ncbi:MAG: porin family protein [Alphaproteobacteria bacterium]|nr:porin family protein [Alphaproteobacteria bacterium]
MGAMLAALSAAVLWAGAGGVALAAEGGGEGFYGRVFGGYSFLESPSIQGDQISNGAAGFGINRGDLRTSSGGWGGGAAGYRWGTLRLEGMGTYESHGAESFTSPQFQYRDLGGTARTDLNANPTLNGDLRIFTGFVNAMLDIDFGSPLQPFIGGGVGFANVRLDNVTGNSRGNNFKLADDSDTVLAFQAMVGVGYKVTDMFTAELGYRFLTMNNPTFSGGGAGEFELGIDSHQLWLGLRVNF